MSENWQKAKLDDVEIAYLDSGPTSESITHADGSNKVVLLIHGFASSARVNWVGTGWVKLLNDAGYRVIALDNRGHGQSSKFYSPDDYGPDIFAADAFALLDHLGVQTCDVMGYSMGSRICCWMCHVAPQRVRKAVFGGMGSHIFGGRGGYEEIAEALETDDPATITSPGAAGFRKFADATHSDRLALAACIRPSKHRITPDIVASVKTPVLVVVGSDDEIAGSAQELADQMPNGQALELPGLDHMKTTGAVAYKKGALEFFDGAGCDT